MLYVGKLIIDEALRLVGLQTGLGTAREWYDSGLLTTINHLLVMTAREQAGREASPTAGVIDSQSVKTATMINQEVGYDAGKRIKGRKRFTLVDTFGLLIAVKVVFCQRFSILLRTFPF